MRENFMSLDEEYARRCMRSRGPLENCVLYLPTIEIWAKEVLRFILDTIIDNEIVPTIPFTLP